MKEYKLLKQGIFEGLSKFEQRLNDTCQHGWKPISMCNKEANILVVLLEKVDKDYRY
jgi:hypothetical protein